MLIGALQDGNLWMKMTNLYNFNVDIFGNVETNAIEVVVHRRVLVNCSNVLVEGTVNTTV